MQTSYYHKSLDQQTYTLITSNFFSSSTGSSTFPSSTSTPHICTHTNTRSKAAKGVDYMDYDHVQNESRSLWPKLRVLQKRTLVLRARILSPLTVKKRQ